MLKPKTLVMLTGIAGAGKSTISHLFEQQGYIRLSTDAIRGDLLGDEGCQDKPNMVWNEFYRRLFCVLDEGRDVVIDNTNTLRKARTPILDAARERNYYTKIFIVDCPPAVAIDRQSLRERKVPTDVILRQHSQLLRHWPQACEADLVSLWKNDSGI